MEKNKLVDLLTLFKKSREKLTSDFSNENIELFEVMFKYENKEELMNLAIEKYFTGYINHHFEKIQNYTNLDQEFSKVMLTFIQKFNINVSDSNLIHGKDLFYEILQKKEDFLKGIIEIGNIDSEKLKKLSYSYEKDKTLFDREIKNIKG